MTGSPSRLVEVTDHGAGCCSVRLLRLDLEENEVYDLCDELLRVVNSGTPRMALALGPELPRFLFSVFLARLITVQRVAHEHGGELKLCHCSQAVVDIFETCKLQYLFEFVPDVATALADWRPSPANPNPATPG